MSCHARRERRVRCFTAALAMLVLGAGALFSGCTRTAQDAEPPHIAWNLRLPLSAEDRAYLQSLPVLRIGIDPQWAPMAFVNASGQIDGISGDYLDFIGDSLGIRFKIVPANSWAQTIQLANSGAVDFVVAATHLDGLDAGFAFSAPYVRYPLVIVTRETAPFIAGADDISGSEIAVVKDSDVLRIGLPGLQNTRELLVGSAEEGLDAVASGRAFAYIGNLGVVDKLVRQKYAGVLRIAAPAGRNQELSFAVAPQYARLLPLINRVLAAIPERERDHIQNSWLSTRFTFGVPTRTLWIVLTPLAVVTIVFLGVLFVYMMRLRVEVRQRRETERQLAELTQGLPAVVFQLRLTGGARRGFSLIFVNRRAYDWLPLRQPGHAQVLETFAACLDTSARFGLERRFMRSARSLERVSAERAFAFADGRRAWIRLEAAPRRLDGGDVVWSGYIHDITEAKQTQMALVAAKHDAEEASRARDTFLATVSHEIRTPIAGLVGILQLLDHGRLARDDQHLLDMARNAAEILLRILNDILDFAKSENGELALEREAMCVADIVERTAGIVAPEMEHKGLHFIVTVSPDLAPSHIGDAQRLGQVLLNLLGNASKFTDYGTVSLSVAAISRDVDQERLLIRVADTGIGIAKEDQARLFSPFAQARNAAAGRYRGTGLGLAICKRLIESMGGTISLESEPGRGTTISIELPLPVDRSRQRMSGQAAAWSQQPAALGETAKPRILVVEDEQINREVLRRQLAAIDIDDCDCATNGVEALKALESRDYAMVITDCAMPVMDGLALIEHIRARERDLGRTGRIAVIALTANAMPQQREACLAAGADEVLVKPVDLGQLRGLLDRYDVATPPARTRDRAGAQPEQQSDLWEQLRRTLASELAVLLSLSLERDGERARDIAHRIVGAAAWFQLKEVAQAGMRLEQALERNEASPADLLALQGAIARVATAGAAPAVGSLP